MKKWIFSLALIFSASLPNASLQMMKAHGQVGTPKKFLSHEIGHLAPETVKTGHLSVRGMEMDGFEGKNYEKLSEAFKVLEAVVNTQEFKDRVINFKNDLGAREFASNNGLSNEEIYAIFMDGRETLQQDTPGEMNFYLNLYYRPWSRVIGYTSGETNKININWKFFKKYSPINVSSNLAHEWTHKLGFGHKSAKEHDSAPYAIGRIVGDIAGRMFAENKLH